MSKFKPVDEEEYAQRNCWKAGWYPATILDAPDSVIEKESSKGDLMYVTKFQVFNDDGKMIVITDYVMAEGGAKFKLRACAEAFGFLEQYKSGSLSEDDLKGKSGYVKLGIQHDESGMYPDKNVISGYSKSLPGTIKASDLAVKKPMTKKEIKENLDDSIPF